MALIVLHIGDIVGRPGRRAVKEILPRWLKDFSPDFVFANGENLASGRGMTLPTYQEMIETGIDYFTTGNHIWQRREFLSQLDDPAIKVLRPANYPRRARGRGLVNLENKGQVLTLLNLIGSVGLGEGQDNPFSYIERQLPEIKSQTIIVDFHAEMTSEKRAMAEMLDGRVTAVIGSHTHVQTNDPQILPKGTFFLTDLGMTGPKDSILGAEKEMVIEKFLTGEPFRYAVAEGPVMINALLLKITDGRVESFDLINQTVDLKES